MSGVFRFRHSTDIAPGAARKLLRKKNLRQREYPFLLAADACSIMDAGGAAPIETYRTRLIPYERCVTLTRREADLVALANPGMRPPAPLEDAHPWLPRTPFVNDAAANFRNLKHIIRCYGRRLVYAADYCDAKWNTVCNAMRMKTDTDARFYAAWHLPIQDVFLLEERRTDRSVIAIDFNGMYAACMQGRFPKPTAMNHIAYHRYLDPHDDLVPGLYRCILLEPISEFIRKHNPFRSFFAGRHLQAMLSEPIEVDLNEFEIRFFRRHFKRIHLVDAVVSDECVAHPLARETRSSFARRKHYRLQGNKPLADREKYLSVLMATCAGRPSRSKRIFDSQEAANVYLKSVYGVAPRGDEQEGAADKWLSQGKKGVAVRETPRGVSVDGPDLYDGSACFMLGQRIVAQGRVLILEMMEKISAVAPQIEICYVNIDSVHFSLPTIHLEQTLAALKRESSEEMGSFKIEAVTRHGLWLEPGRYWLYGDKIEKFRNRSVGDRITPFKDHAIRVASAVLDNLHIPIRIAVRMDRSMSDMRTIIEDMRCGVARQHLIDVGDASYFGEVLNRLEDNRKHAIAKKMQAFNDLRLRFVPLSRDEAYKPALCGAKLPRRGVFEEHWPQERTSRTDPARARLLDVDNKSNDDV